MKGKGHPYSEDDIILIECAATSGNYTQFRKACEAIGRTERAVTHYLRKNGITRIAQRAWSSTELQNTGKSLTQLERETGYHRATFSKAIKDLKAKPHRKGRSYRIGPKLEKQLLDYLAARDSAWGTSREGRKTVRWAGCQGCGSTTRQTDHPRSHFGNGLCKNCLQMAHRRAKAAGVDNPTPDMLRRLAKGPPIKSSYSLRCDSCGTTVERDADYHNRYAPDWVCQRCRERVVAYLKRQDVQNSFGSEGVGLRDLESVLVIRLARMLQRGRYPVFAALNIRSPDDHT